MPYFTFRIFGGWREVSLRKNKKRETEMETFRMMTVSVIESISIHSLIILICFPVAKLRSYPGIIIHTVLTKG